MPVKAVFSFRLNFKYPNLVFQKVFDIVPICKESINCYVHAKSIPTSIKMSDIQRVSKFIESSYFKHL